MSTENQVIQKGSIVQSRQYGWQGIVMSINTNLRESGQSEDNVKEFMAMREPKVTEEQAAERWIVASDFSFMTFSIQESDLFIIPPSDIRFSKFPCAFLGHIRYVEKQLDSDSVLLILDTNLTKSAACKGYTNGLFIVKPTVTPLAFDTICGTQDYVIISADGLNYPYRKEKNVLTQDW